MPQELLTQTLVIMQWLKCFTYFFFSSLCRSLPPFFFLFFFCLFCIFHNAFSRFVSQRIRKPPRPALYRDNCPLESCRHLHNQQAVLFQRRQSSDGGPRTASLKRSHCSLFASFMSRLISVAVAFNERTRNKHRASPSPNRAQITSHSFQMESYIYLSLGHFLSMNALDHRLISLCYVYATLLLQYLLYKYYICPSNHACCLLISVPQHALLHKFRQSAAPKQ